MKKFRFKLEALLRMRRIEEEKALGELARVMLRVNEQKSVQAETARMLREEMDRFDSEYKESFDLELWKIYDRYVDRLNAEAEVAAEKLEEIRPEMEAEMAKVMEARRQRRIVELLKERARDEYDAERRKNERRELEEANRRSNSNVGGSIAGALYETGALAPIFTGAPAGVGQPPAARTAGQQLRDEQRRRQRDTQDGADEDEFRESEQPEQEPDHVADYFKRMGLGDPPPGFGK